MDLTEYIYPSLLILVPVLWIIGKMLKDNNRIHNKHIPLILGVISIILAAIQVLSGAELSGWRDHLAAIFSSIVQGILCAGLAVYGNQMVKQYKQ